MPVVLTAMPSSSTSSSSSSSTARAGTGAFLGGFFVGLLPLLFAFFLLPPSSAAMRVREEARSAARERLEVARGMNKHRTVSSPRRTSLRLGGRRRGRAPIQLYFAEPAALLATKTSGSL